MLKFGKITLKYPLILAPLSGYSDRAMRAVSRQCGVELAFAGLMLDKSASHPKVIKKITYQPHCREHPVGAQIHGTDPDVMADAAVALEQVGYDLIDINFACPARKVLARGRGGALLDNPVLARDISRAVRDAVKCPVGIKLRIGMERSKEHLRKFWQICDNAVADGVDFMTIHGRSVGQKYHGCADWEIVKEVKNAYSETTILGSGDLFKPEDCVEKLTTSGVDGLSIARGAIGNPWIFRDIIAVLEGQALPAPPDLQQQAKVIKEHVDMVFQLYHQRKSVGYFRKFAARYAHLHPQRKKASLDIMAAKSADQLYAALKRWYPM